jgi:hypothetical protein
MRRFTIFTSPVSGTHAVGEPEGPPLAKFEADRREDAEAFAGDLMRAVSLAHNDRDGHPAYPLKNPPPTVAEALAILKDSIKLRKHTWLTGEKAIETLTRALSYDPRPKRGKRRG